MKTTRLEPFGIRIDLDLRQPLADGVVAELRARFYEHHLLLFCDQSLDREQQRRVAHYFGRVPDTASDTPFVSNVLEDALGSAELSFHSDDEYCEKPLDGITLFALAVEDGLTATRFANGVEAYRRLPPALKARLEGLQARHMLSTDGNARSHGDLPDSRWPHAVHPVVKRHPATGEPILYVTQLQTSAILGMTGEESEALIEELFSHLYAPENVRAHYWRKGDLVVWDNLALQHARADVGASVERTLQRVSIGTTLLEQRPNFRADFAEITDTILNNGLARAG